MLLQPLFHLVGRKELLSCLESKQAFLLVPPATKMKVEIQVKGPQKDLDLAFSFKDISGGPLKQGCTELLNAILPF